MLIRLSISFLDRNHLLIELTSGPNTLRIAPTGKKHMRLKHTDLSEDLKDSCSSPPLKEIRSRAPRSRLGRRLSSTALIACITCVLAADDIQRTQTTEIGREVAIARHLSDGEEFSATVTNLLKYGAQIFSANWTVQEGQGRPFLKGTGKSLSDPSSPLLFPRNMNRLSGPDANSCAGCHNVPFAGGAGDAATNVFVLGQRFDSMTFDPSNSFVTGGTFDERGVETNLLTFSNSRATPGLFGAGYYELLAREITADLRAIASSIDPGQSAPLLSKGISFGVLRRSGDGRWDVSAVGGLPPQATATSGDVRPTLVLQPWHQAGGVVSLRQFTNNAFLQHHGMEPEERVGRGIDLDGYGFVNELTRADITAVTIFQAAIAVPGRVIPTDTAVREAIATGEKLFANIGCVRCHVPSLPLRNWIYTEPSPFNPQTNLQLGEVSVYAIDLTSPHLPGPRLRLDGDVINVPVYTDFKLHNLCDTPMDPNAELLDQNRLMGSAAFFEGNQLFLTKRLWDIGSKPNHFHHGKFTTIRESILAHGGEARENRKAFIMLGADDQGAIIEFLKSLRVLPPGTKSLTVDENGDPVKWPR